MRAERRRRPDDRTEVARVGHAVQGHQQSWWRSLRAGEQVVGMGVLKWRYRQRQPLMRRGTAYPVQFGPCDVRDGHPAARGKATGLVKTFVVVGSSSYVEDGRRDARPQRLDHRVAADHQLVEFAPLVPFRTAGAPRAGRTSPGRPARAAPLRRTGAAGPGITGGPVVTGPGAASPVVTASVVTSPVVTLPALVGGARSAGTPCLASGGRSRSCPTLGRVAGTHLGWWGRSTPLQALSPLPPATGRRAFTV